MLINKNEEYVSLLPFYVTPTTLLVSERLINTPIEKILSELNREIWVEGLYVQKNDIDKIKRYKNSQGIYKNDFNEEQFIKWVKLLDENTALYEMENKTIGRGVFVPPGKTLPAGTFIPSSGIIKLNPSYEELATKTHCSALQDLNSPQREIIGLIDPALRGGLLDFINHAPDSDEIENFIFKNSATKNNVAMANVKSTIKFYNGYAIMGVEVFKDINGHVHGKQLLWSYARADEYIENNICLCLFDNRDECSGKIIDINAYSLKEITIFLDAGELMLRRVASLTRWEIMEKSPKAKLIISTEDPYSLQQSEAIQSPISYGFLQASLRKNPIADRVVIRLPVLE